MVGRASSQGQVKAPRPRRRRPGVMVCGGSGGSGGGHVHQVGRFGGRPRRRRQPGGGRPDPGRDIGRQRRYGAAAGWREDCQVVDQENPAGEGAAVQLASDRREAPIKPGEALVSRAGVAQLGYPGPETRQRPQRPGQACEREAGQEADVVAARSDRDQDGVRGDGVELGGLPGGRRTEDVAGGRAGERDVGQVQRERLGDEVRVVAGRPAGPARAAGNPGRKTRTSREGASHRHVTAPGRDRHLILHGQWPPVVPSATAGDKQRVGDAEAGQGDQPPPDPPG
jgi:hypothetical protein